MEEADPDEISLETFMYLIEPIRNALEDNFNGYNKSLVLSTIHSFNIKIEIQEYEEYDENEEFQIGNQEKDKSWYQENLEKNKIIAQCITTQEKG